MKRFLPPIALLLVLGAALALTGCGSSGKSSPAARVSTNPAAESPPTVAAKPKHARRHRAARHHERTVRKSLTATPRPAVRSSAPQTNDGVATEPVPGTQAPAGTPAPTDPAPEATPPPSTTPEAVPAPAIGRSQSSGVPSAPGSTAPTLCSSKTKCGGY